MIVRLRSSLQSDTFLRSLRNDDGDFYDYATKQFIIGSSGGRSEKSMQREIRPPARTDCRGGGEEAGQPLGKGVFGQLSLDGNRWAALHLATRVFLAGNHISDEQRDKEQATKFEKLKVAQTSFNTFKRPCY